MIHKSCLRLNGGIGLWNSWHFDFLEIIIFAEDKRSGEGKGGKYNGEGKIVATGRGGNRRL